MKFKEKICIYGDYDADGVTSSALLKDVFDQLGIKNFCYIPDRNKEGYGINKKAIDFIKSKNAGLIITVDCGISNYKEVEYAKSKKIEIIILDHHHIPPRIPKAFAVVDAKLDKDINNSKELAGVGIAFKFAQGLISKVNHFNKENLKWLLDLVCVGTIADCVPLFGENRILTKFGLIVLSQTKRIGFRQIFSVGKINVDENNLPTSQQVAFQLAPRINAAGRMDHANTAFKLLSLGEKKEAQARILALELESQNQHRRKVTKVIIDEVEKKISAFKKIPSVIIESSPFWEVGIIGLAAGNIADKYYRPVILLKSEDGLNKGSGRSIKEFDLISSLEENSTLLEKYGGHCQAAGLVVSDDNLKEFSKRMERQAKIAFRDDVVKSLDIDAKISFSEINDKLLNEMELLEPFGNGNARPIFLAENIEVVNKKLVGSNNNHLKLWVKDKKSPGVIFEAIGFGMGKRYSKISLGKRTEIVFNLEKNNWNGQKKIQIKLIDFI